MKPKNIAILLSTLNGGGAERIAGLLSKELAKIYNVYIFLKNSDNIVYEYGGTIVDVCLGKEGIFYEYAVKELKEKYQIDVSISFMEPMNFTNIRTRNYERIILSERSVQSLIDPPAFADNERIMRYYDSADAIVSCSEGCKYDLVYNYGVRNQIKTIYNFINKEAILSKSNNDKDFLINDFLCGEEYYLNIGRLHPQKNQLRLISQFACFHKKHCGIKLVILGSGMLENELNQHIRDLGLEDCVKIVPYTRNPFVYIRHAKALILSSRYEGLPNVILEAMTIGCPIIATDCLSGPRELLGGVCDYSKKYDNITVFDRGIMVTNDVTEDKLNTTYMAQAMAIVSENESICKKMVMNQKRYMLEYTNKKIVDQWIDVIEDSGKKVANVLANEQRMMDSAKYLFIYGYGLIGTNTYLSLKRKYKIEGFVVTNKSNVKQYLFDKPVYEIGEISTNPEETVFIMGAGGRNANEIFKKISDYGYKKVCFPYLEPVIDADFNRR